MTKTIRISAALVVRDDGHVLLVRKRGTPAFMQPGGKIEPGETAEEALIRELFEEIGLVATIAELEFLGQFEAPAANEPDHVVVADIFQLHIDGHAVSAVAEIEEIRWVSPAEPGDILMAALTEHHILPLNRQLRAAIGD
ncbi:NUDIX domain-containing protein [Rhizobium sp. Pop5]|uniref:NUDIX hydrolase n=1 Tax=Rhizobium sp. Pop5 TaxID=1223565 RepID=UPI000560B22D|nr:NUDIX domain-containing protein [Rhizobium sp. Pop5]UVD58242.1 NUDIX domain-containing protein [Rhizobium sp. Pop5]